MKYYLWVIGCQYNEWDGARLRHSLDSLGLQESSDKEADAIVIVACSVRQTAVDRIFGHVKNWNHNTDHNNTDLNTDNPKTSKNKNSNGIIEQLNNGKLILITGCVLDTDKKKFTEKGIQFFNSGDFETLKKMIVCHSEPFSFVQGKLREESDICVIPSEVEGSSYGKILRFTQDDSPKNLTPNNLKNYPPNACSYVPIMIGCNNFCSYCAVPYVRGRERSRSMEEIIADVKSIIKYHSSQKGDLPAGKAGSYSMDFSADKPASKSKIEIILLGQNVNSYSITDRSVIPHLMRNPLIVPACRQGRDSRRSLSRALTRGGNDKHEISDFTRLLMILNNLDGDFKIGFISNHPKDMSNDIIEAVATLPKIKKQIHLPLQSGSDKILKAMNRPYTTKQYLQIVKNLKFKIQNLKLTTDVIVGFPGESKADFQKTVKIMKKVNFKQAYINKYSPRVGTAAFKLGDPIPWSEKQRRWRVLNNIANK